MKCICENLRKSGFYRELILGVKNKNLPMRLARVSEGLKGHLLHTLFEDAGNTLFFVCPSDFEAKSLFEGYLYPEKVYLPSPQTELSHIDTRSTEIAAQRTLALCRISRKPSLVFTSAQALLYKMRPKKSFLSHFFRLKAGMIIEPRDLQKRFADAGYEYSALIEGKGQFSGRGEIAEIYPPEASSPYRITFFDDEIETIRLFDPDTQRSYGDNIDEIEICPAFEINLGEEERAEIREYLEKAESAELRATAGRLIYELDDTGTFANVEAYADVFADKCSILDWVHDPLIVFNDLFKLNAEHKARLETSAVLFGEVLQNGGAFGCENSTLFELEGFLRGNAEKIVDLEGIIADSTLPKVHELSADVSSSVGFLNNMEMLSQAVRDRLEGDWTVYLFAASRARQLGLELKNYGLEAAVTDGKPMPGLSIVNGRISAGFMLNDVKAAFLSEEDIFGRKLRGERKKSRKKASLDLVADLKAGDTVVHEIYGKGRYNGIKNMEVGGTKGDYLEIEYKDGDKLFIKTSQIDKISRFVGSDDDSKRLSKLGGKEWDSAKAKARSSIKKLTEDLVSIYEERAKIKGFQYAEDTPWQSQFEDNFEYEETQGQIDCTEQIKRDMQSTKVMDRLLLGDVGYGKTEVAMRAAFKAVMDSKQVALLVPTTLLARQHYKSFLDRFSGFPVKIAMLSRFTKNPGKVVSEINSGAVDIVIGTHKLLSKTIKYKDLGLLIVDEEQRFGVSHKERIKDMKRTVDVLTLTATPIPRTLEMAMTGIRDISTIDTPPEDRKEVIAYVAEFNWQMVREAIMRELARGGQAYFVCRRISQMDELLKNLHQFVPEARVAMAHGRMNEETFESVISAFYEKQFDVLLSTTIIESGIDIPSVNTIIIYEADMFGLAQLYQLKGRVGRSHLRAYAYFTHIRTTEMNEIAQKRLAAIREFTQFGSGYKIAMRDLEIRGAGNILGAEQSGHMAQIGYNLYCKFIRQEVDTLLGRPEPISLDCEIDLGLDAFIPEKYIPDEAQKLDMYRAALSIRTTKDVTELRDTLQERYGTPPKQVENLLAYRLIRSYAEKAGIASVIRQQKVIELKFAEADIIEVDELAVRKVVSQYPLFAAYRQSTPPAIILKQQKNYVNEMLKLLSQLKRCIKPAHKV